MNTSTFNTVLRKPWTLASTLAVCFASLVPLPLSAQQSNPQIPKQIDLTTFPAQYAQYAASMIQHVQPSEDSIYLYVGEARIIKLKSPPVKNFIGNGKVT